ncbi:MAG: hypothetical protein NVS2B16_26330 [Chloroflexota bacterium]
MLVDRYGRKIVGDRSELLLCPKPHIGPGRIDLVSRAQHCCADPTLCHIIGQPESHKPVRLPRTGEDLVKELRRLFENRQDVDAEDLSLLARQVEGLTRSLAEVTGAIKRIDLYYQRLRDLGMQSTLHLLNSAEQESLALGIFLVEQLDYVAANDYSAAAIQIARVIEGEVVRRVFSCPGLVGSLANMRSHTLGVLPAIARNPWNFDDNWPRLVAYTKQHWNGHVDPDQPDLDVQFKSFALALEPIGKLRNQAAHPHPFSRALYSQLQTICLQASQLGPGILNMLLVAWHHEYAA